MGARGSRRPRRSGLDSVDPRDAIKVPRKVVKGGSHLCAPNYCRRYRPAKAADATPSAV